MTKDILSGLNELTGLDLKSRRSKGNFIVFPGICNPKLLLPNDLPRKGLSSALELYPVLSPRQFLKKQIISLLYRVRDVLPPTFRVLYGDREFASILYGELSEHRKFLPAVRHCAIRTGSAGKGKKLIFQFLDKHGEILCYIKTGDPEHRAKWLENEKKMLQYLSGNCSDILVVPRVTGYRSTTGFVALELSPLAGFRYYPLVPFRQLVEKWTELVIRTRAERTFDPTEATRQLPGLIRDPETQHFVQEHLDNIVAHATHWSVSHRDMPAWNVLSNQKGELAILDWEFARQGHNPFQDLFHYRIHTMIHNARKVPEQALSAFFRDRETTSAIAKFGQRIGINDPGLIFSHFIFYLWDWFQLERSNAQSDEQGMEYLGMMTYLANHENRHQYAF